MLGGCNTNDKYSVLMNLKYNRIDMKNGVKDQKVTRRLRQRPTQPSKSKLYKKRTTREKRSPATRDFGTDLTNHPEPIATETAPKGRDISASPSEITPYLQLIVEHLIQKDQTFSSRIACQLALHSDFGESKISTEMRKVLLRWLMQVSKKFQVKDETMQICVQIIDYLLLFQSTLIAKHNFQLLGVSALFVASKYNQIHTFEAEKYIYLCDGLYSVQQLFEMESLILATTNFNLQFPTLQQFAGLVLEHYGMELDSTVRDLIRLSMFDCLLFNRYKKQHLASVIIYFAAKINESSMLRSRDIIEELGVPQQIFRECFQILLGLYRSRQELK